MLREIPGTRQIRGEPRRRWFNSEFMDTRSRIHKVSSRL
jgi:hypothetical protein